MEDSARDFVTPCSSCRDPNQIDYEPLQGGYICTGCGAVLSQEMVTELPSTLAESDKGVQIGGRFVAGHGASALPLLSQKARQRAGTMFGTSNRRRERIHRLCQQLALPAGVTDEVLNLIAATNSPGVAGEVACLYTVCRRRDRDLTFSDVCAAACIHRRLAGRCLRRLHAGDTARPDRFVKRAVNALGGSFDDEKRAMQLLPFMTSSSSRQPHITAYAAVVIVISANRSIPAPDIIAERLSVNKRALQSRVVEAKNVLLALGKILPLGIVLTLNNIHLYYNLIIDNLALLSDIQRKPAPAHDSIVSDYNNAIAKFGPRSEERPPPDDPAESSLSDVDSMSDNEASLYIRSENEIQDQIRLQQRLTSH